MILESATACYHVLLKKNNSLYGLKNCDTFKRNKSEEKYRKILLPHLKSETNIKENLKAEDQSQDNFRLNFSRNPNKVSENTRNVISSQNLEEVFSLFSNLINLNIDNYFLFKIKSFLKKFYDD